MALGNGEQTSDQPQAVEAEGGLREGREQAEGTQWENYSNVALFVSLFETGSHYVASGGLKLKILP
jgi:hypothetical protein